MGRRKSQCISKDSMDFWSFIDISVFKGLKVEKHVSLYMFFLLTYLSAISHINQVNRRRWSLPLALLKAALKRCGMN